MLLSTLGCITTQEKGKSAAKDAGGGAAAGALVGLALGRITGLPTGEAATEGAKVEVYEGAKFELENTRDDRRTKELKEATGGANEGETIDQAGKRHFKDFTGYWDLDIWAKNPDGSTITGSGRAKVILESENTLRLEFQYIRAPGYDWKLTGYSLIIYSPNKGFVMENHFSDTEAVRRYIGEYIPDRNVYCFYPSNKYIEDPALRGTLHSNIRIEAGASSTELVVFETFVLSEGKEIKMQSYRFIRRYG
jgi:hypothetical protein